MAGQALNILYMGSPDFAVPTLEKLFQSRHTISAVISGTDKRRGRGSKKSPTPVKKAARQLGLPVIEADSMKDPGLADKIRALRPDLIVVVAFKILPESILEIPVTGSINLHASLLPKYRGAAPIHHAIMNGEKQTGCTVFFLDKGVDTGNIILQKRTDILPNENTGDLYERLSLLGADLVVEAVDQIADGTYTLSLQDDALATPAPKIFPDDCRLDPNLDAAGFRNKVRGLCPFPGAYFYLDGMRIKVRGCRPASENVPTGKIRFEDGRALLGCGEGSVELVEIQPEGKPGMAAADFFRGYNGPMQLDAS